MPNTSFAFGLELSESGVRLVSSYFKSLGTPMSDDETLRQATPDQVAAAFAHRTRLPVLKGVVRYASDELISAVGGPGFCQANLCLPLASLDSVVYVGVVHPLSISMVEERISRSFPGSRISRCLIPYDDFVAFWTAKQSGSGVDAGLILDQIESDDDEKRERTLDLGSDSTGNAIEDALRTILREGLKRQASDVHIHSTESRLLLEYRIRGILTPDEELPFASSNRLDACLIRLADRSTSDRAHGPISGRFSVLLGNRKIAVRYERRPLINGWHAVMRYLDTAGKRISLGEGPLALPESTMLNLNRLIYASEGLVLITGPTGSGKTTTLYAVLDKLNTSERNIVSIEDPVEAVIPGIKQSQIRTQMEEKKSEEMRKYLSSFMRQDPNIVLVGEIRDAATATAAINLANTGQLVFATLHAKSAASAPQRLVDLGIARSSISGNLIGTIAQRLVRRVCPDCAIKNHILKPEDCKLYGLDYDEWAKIEVAIAKPGGCSTCGHSGYADRIALMEVLPITGEVEEVISRPDSTTYDIEQRARSLGFMSLRDHGLHLVRSKKIDFAELSRKVNLTLR
jgi:type II secretory ATPase GspE/PulE/Tfp pilus assembly ATPase PilB-like protein